MKANFYNDSDRAERIGAILGTLIKCETAETTLIKGTLEKAKPLKSSSYSLNGRIRGFGMWLACSRRSGSGARLEE